MTLSEKLYMDMPLRHIKKLNRTLFSLETKMCEKTLKIGKNRGFLQFKAKVYLDKIFFCQKYGLGF